MSTLTNEHSLTQTPSGARPLIGRLQRSGSRIWDRARTLLRPPADDTPRPRLFLAGTGAVGSALLDQLAGLPPGRRPHLSLVCNSRQTLLREQGIDYATALEELRGGRPTNWKTILAYVTLIDPRQGIFVDATGDPDVARRYGRLLESGIHVVTPSKRANSFEQSYYDKLHELAADRGVSYRYETTVGAGLPVLSTLEDLRRSGDTVTEISGVVSGTMTYLFNQLEQDVPFSRAVGRARELGYAEPDPREDLSGEDVARKFLILARCLGHRLERDQLEVESLIPEELEQVDAADFLDRLSEYDQSWRQQLARARKSGDTLRYVGSLSPDGKVRVGVREVPLRSPEGRLEETDNLLRIRSDRYRRSPILIQGPGAGREVTAAGVLSDILKIG